MRKVKQQLEIAENLLGRIQKWETLSRAQEMEVRDYFRDFDRQVLIRLQGKGKPK